MRAALAGDVVGGLLLFRRDDRAAGEALLGAGGQQLGVERGAVVEDEAVAVVVVGADFLEVLEDAAFELVDVLQADLLHVDGCLFAADAAGAERHHCLAGEIVLVRGDGGREFGEFPDAVFDRVAERADRDFEAVARVEHHHLAAVVVMALVQPALERGGRQRWRAAVFRADQRIAHGDDLFLQAHQQPAERLVVGEAFLGRQVGKARIGAQPADDAVDRLARAGQEDVDALGCQQDRALQVACLAFGEQGRAQRLAVVEGDEFVSGNVDDLHVLPRRFEAPG